MTVRLLATFLAVFLLAPPTAAADPAGNQLVTGAALQAGVSAGTFIATASCPGGSQVVTLAQFTGCVQTNGACATSPANALPTWNALIACRVLFTILNPVADPWFTAGANVCCWTGSNSTPTFFSDTSASGAPSNAQSLSAGTIVESISPSSLLANTPIVFRIQVNQTQSTQTPVDCAGTAYDPVSITGITTIQVVGPGNAVVGSLNDTTPGWHTIALSTTASAGTGQYTLVVTQASRSASYASPHYTIPPRGPPGDPPPDPICVDGSRTFSAGGKATGASVGNS